jgi:hypothetical protein
MIEVDFLDNETSLRSYERTESFKCLHLSGLRTIRE